MILFFTGFFAGIVFSFAVLAIVSVCTSPKVFPHIKPTGPQRRPLVSPSEESESPD
jgi:hypothetical protein